MRKLLRELTAALDPFPSFMGLSSVQAVEIDPASVPDSNRGCVVICPDGELHELVLRLVPGPVDLGGVDQVEEMKPLELSPGDYVAYAHAAVQQLTRLLEEKGS